MKHIWSIFCEKSAIDLDTNILSAFSFVENLNFIVNKKNLNNPLIIPANFQLISYWDLTDDQNNSSLKDNSTLEMRISLVGPNKESLKSLDFSFPILDTSKRFRVRTAIEGLQVTETGKYFFTVSNKNRKGDYELVAKVPFSVTINYKD